MSNEASAPVPGVRGVQVGAGNFQVNLFGSEQASPVPRQLPPGDPYFTNRKVSLAELDNLLARSSATPAISIVAGVAGVGKTALVVHWARQMRDRFPDGELYVNLRGYDSVPPATPAQVIEGFLLALGVTANRIPGEINAQVGLFRSILHGRRILIVLDNARSAEQIRPLLPESVGCFVLVTSRSNLSGLAARNGARRIRLDMLPHGEAVELMRTVIADRRIEDEADAMDAMVRRCAYLPLALRIAGERAVARSRTPLARIAAELDMERRRLDALSLVDDETAVVRSVFSYSYRALPAEAARAFRLLGLHGGADFGEAASAALIGKAASDTLHVLDVLINAHLLEEVGPGRYQFHDLLREYAVECADADESEEGRTAAVLRLLSWYTRTAEAAAAVMARTQVGPRELTDRDSDSLFATHAEAFSWFRLEVSNIVATVHQAAHFGENDVLFRLCQAMGDYFRVSMSFEAFNAVSRIGLTVAMETGDRLRESVMLGNLGRIANYRGERREALRYQQESVAIVRDLGRVRPIDLANLGSMYGVAGHGDQAVVHLTEALELARKVGDRRVQGSALECLANTYNDLQQYDWAARYAEKAIEVFRSAGLLYGEGIALRRLAYSYSHLGRVDDALECGERALSIGVELSDHFGQASAHRQIAHALRCAGRWEAATEHLLSAIKLYEGIGLTNRAAEVRASLASSGAD
ncbi:ATP-binding protein [Polymorphospora rubra]|uniref:ATP-binding protein n=1 Tax=Polymorphospora rubra TaxID=338584 RepID=UPI0033C3FB50